MREVRPRLSLPPEQFCSGVRPKRGGELATRTEALGLAHRRGQRGRGDHTRPGIVARRCYSSLDRCQASNSLSKVDS
jgi:hypothetical protein